MNLAERVKRVKPSPTLAVAAKAKEMKSQGIDVIDFGVGEPDFDTPSDIKDAAIKAIYEGFTKYTAPSGIDELKDAIIDKLKKDNGLIYERNQIIVSCGAKHSLYNIAQVLFEKGDEVIVPAPFWVSYPDQILLNDATPVIVKTSEKNNFRLTPEDLERHITPKTKALILNSPSNPTGSAYDKASLALLTEIIIKHKIYVISDEIYEKILYDGNVHTSIASLNNEIKDLTLVVNGVSKSYSMTGWRIGYTAGPKDAISAMSTVQSQSTSNPSSISQKAAVAALRGSDQFINKMVVEFDKRRKYIVDRFKKMKGIKCPKPDGAFYVFPNVSGLFGNKIKNSDEMTDYFLKEGHVAVVSGESFGAEGYIRLSYATSMDNIIKGMDMIENVVSKI